MTNVFIVIATIRFLTYLVPATYKELKQGLNQVNNILFQGNSF